MGNSQKKKKKENGKDDILQSDLGGQSGFPESISSHNAVQLDAMRRPQAVLLLTQLGRTWSTVPNFLKMLLANQYAGRRQPSECTTAADYESAMNVQIPAVESRPTVEYMRFSDSSSP